MNIKEKFGKEIKRLRTSKGYSQEDFSKLCGLHRTYISDIEQGNRNISIENIEKISEALNIMPSDLLSFNTPVKRSITMSVNGEQFNLESNLELTRELKNHLEAISESMYDEENEWYHDIYEMSNYEIFKLFEKIVLEETGILLRPKVIDLELIIEE